MSFPANILKIRTKLKMSQVAFAKHVGLSNGYICQLEIGTRSPRITTLNKLAGRLKVKPTDLLK